MKSHVSQISCFNFFLQNINICGTDLFSFIFYGLISQHGKEVCISTMQQVRVRCTLPCGFSVLFSVAYFFSWFQLDFAVTISALLGIPFPFGRCASLT